MTSSGGPRAAMKKSGAGDAICKPMSAMDACAPWQIAAATVRRSRTARPIPIETRKRQSSTTAASASDQPLAAVDHHSDALLAGTARIVVS